MTTNTHIAAQQDAFERAFPMPAQCTRFTGGYAPTGYNAWAAQAFCEKWEGWKACAQAIEAAELGEGEAVAEVVGLQKLENESRHLTPRIVPLTLDLPAGTKLYLSPAPALDVQGERSLRNHVEGFALKHGWNKDEGEGAFEFVQRKCYVQGWIDHGTKSRDREDDTSAPQDEGHDAGRVGGEGGPTAEQHHEHRAGKSGVDREHDQRDCRGAGVHGASDLPPQVAQAPAFVYHGETYRDLESMLEGYNFGTAFYTSPPPPLALVEPLSEEQHAQIYERLHRVGGELNFVSPIAYGKEVERAHGIVTKESA